MRAIDLFIDGSGVSAGDWCQYPVDSFHFTGSTDAQWVCTNNVACGLNDYNMEGLAGSGNP